MLIIRLLILTVALIVIPGTYALSLDEPAVITRNPFTPQLPKKVKIVEEKPKPGSDNSDKNLSDKPKPDNQKIQTQTPVTADLKAPELPQPKFTITGILWNSDRPQAIINGQVVDIGDIVQEFKIESIDPTGIEVSFKGVKMTVKP
ncbi:MAG: hypothetical protein AB7S78_02010 [Candidatus Omnitrophota bacterium]